MLSFDGWSRVGSHLVIQYLEEVFLLCPGDGQTRGSRALACAQVTLAAGCGVDVWRHIRRFVVVYLQTLIWSFVLQSQQPTHSSVTGPGIDGGSGLILCGGIRSIIIMICWVNKWMKRRWMNVSAVYYDISLILYSSSDHYQLGRHLSPPSSLIGMVLWSSFCRSCQMKR